MFYRDTVFTEAEVLVVIEKEHKKVQLGMEHLPRYAWYHWYKWYNDTAGNNNDIGKGGGNQSVRFWVQQGERKSMGLGLTVGQISTNSNLSSSMHIYVFLTASNTWKNYCGWLFQWYKET